jgi:hypothetical protein
MYGGLFKYDRQTSFGWTLGCVKYPTKTSELDFANLAQSLTSGSSVSATTIIKQLHLGAGMVAEDPNVKAAAAMVRDMI